jgi:hypothetical protein
MDNITTIDPTTTNNWNQIISTLEGNSIFHTSNWAKVLKETYHFTPKYLLGGNAGKSEFILPIMGVKSFLTGHRGVSLPFTDFCGPLIKDEFSVKDAIDSITSIAKNQHWDSLQIRGGHPLFQDKTPSTFYLNHILKFGKTDDEIFSNFKSNLRRNIKKALKQDIKIIVDNSYESLKKFFQLNCLTRKKHGLPPQPFQFFENILKHIINQGLGSIFLAEFNGSTIAAAIYFHFNNKALYKFGASNDKFQLVRANNLIMWEAIKHFNSLGYKELDFGKTAPNNTGLQRYKLDYGPVEKERAYYKYDTKTDNFIHEELKENGWHNKVFSKLPISALKVSGSLLYRHVA